MGLGHNHKTSQHWLRTTTVSLITRCHSNLNVQENYQMAEITIDTSHCIGLISLTTK